MQSIEERERKIANILETYFSDASLLWDKVMLNKILANPDGSKFWFSKTHKIFDIY
jgi:hypothetical protein